MFKRDVREMSKILILILSSMIFYQVDESNLLVWQGLLVPDKAPYNKVK